MVEGAASPELGEGILISGSRVLAAADEGQAFYRRVGTLLAAFLQVKNLSILIGAGPSYPLGSPQIRAMTVSDIEGMITAAGITADAESLGLVSQLVEREGGTIDLEGMLRTLGAALSLAGGSDAIQFTEIATSAPTVLNTRHMLNRALAAACDLPKGVPPESDPLQAHRSFFRRLLRARRLDLPRVRVFTTNYDLLIEKALDQDGITYFDGFSGTVERIFRPETFERDLFLPPDPDQRRMLRVPDLLYLHKLHGSINWRSRSRSSTAGEDVIQVPTFQPSSGDELAIIFPTPLKEGDVLAYPYSVMFRTFMAALAEPDSALLSIGFGFADDHINRQILQALGSPSFQLMAVAPSSVIENCARVGDSVECAFTETAMGSLAQTDDARITVLTGTAAGTFNELAMRCMPDTAESGEDTPTRTQDAVASSLLKS